MQQKSLHWYPGHMQKAMRQIEEKLKLIDVVVEVVDSRIPLSSKNPFLENLTSSKKRLLVFSKKDLVNVIMYANSDLAAYVWKNEINHAETIDENHMDQADLWIAINKIIKRKSINFCVIGEQSMFNSINHSENKRAAHE